MTSNTLTSTGKQVTSTIVCAPSLISTVAKYPHRIQSSDKPYDVTLCVMSLCKLDKKNSNWPTLRPLS